MNLKVPLAIRRDLGLYATSAVVVGMTIGFGCFLLDLSMRQTMGMYFIVWGTAMLTNQLMKPP